jgi:hypothetical protein
MSETIPASPWVGTLYGPPEVTGDQMVAAMDAVGVDGAILVSPRRPRNLRCVGAGAASGGASSQRTTK